MKFISLALISVLVGLALRAVIRPKQKNGKREWTRWGKKFITVLLFITVLSLFVTFLAASINLLPEIFDSFAKAIQAVGKLFRNPGWEDLLLIIVGVIRGALILLFELFLLALAMFLWSCAMEFKETHYPQKKSKIIEALRLEKIEIPLLGKITSGIEKVGELIDRDVIKNKIKSFADILKKPIIPHFKKHNENPTLAEKCLSYCFWISVFLTWAGCEFYTLTSFYFFLIISSTSAVILLITNSFREIDRMVLQYLLEEIKDLPKRIKDIWKEAFGSLEWALFVTLLYMLLIEKLNFKQLDFTILISRVGINFIRFFIIVYCIKIIIYSAKKISGTRAAETLGGISASMMLFAGYSESFLPKAWGTTVFWIYYSLGFTASFFTIRFNLKKLSLKKRKPPKKQFIIILFKFVAVVMFTSIIIELLFGFLILGMYPGTTSVSQTCSENMIDAMNNYFKATAVFKEFSNQSKKGFDEADFSMISKTFSENSYIQNALKSFAALKENAVIGRKNTWHRFNLFGLYYWLGDSMILISDYMYMCLPSFFQYIQVHSKEINEFVETFKKRKDDLKTSDAVLDSKRHLSNRQAMEKILEKLKDCNNRFEMLNPSWMWLMVPYLGKYHKFMLNFEARAWIFLNYTNLKKKYNDEYIVIKRTKVLRFGSSVNHKALSDKYGDILIFPFDQKILIYCGIGELK